MWKKDRAGYNKWFESMSGVSADPAKVARASSAAENANPSANPTTSTGGDD